MKKRGILNSSIAAAISNLGHTDLIMIADCGLPIDKSVDKIDISLKPGSPNFLDVYKIITNEVFIEKQFLASEIITENKNIDDDISGKFETEYISHEKLKELSLNCKLIIRTGEITPYANVILQSGVNFKELYENSSD